MPREGMEFIWFMQTLQIMVAVCFFGFFYFAYKLYRESDRSKYWLLLLIGVFLLGVSHWARVMLPPVLFEAQSNPIWERRPMWLPLLYDTANIAGSLLLAIAFYGLYRTMADIRKRVE